MRLRALSHYFRSSSPSTASDWPVVYLEHRGQDRIETISRAVRKAPWLVTSLELAWTAGPVTFLAAFGGYYFGYGEVPPANYLAFFFAYSVIAGIIGVVTRFVHSAIRDARQARAQRDLTLVLDILPDLIISVRDLALSGLEPDARRREAAALLLRKADLGPEYIGMAVHELTDNRALAEAIEKIEIFRRAGLFHRMQETSAAWAKTSETVFSSLSGVAPETVSLLRERLAGRAPSLAEGLPRADGFVERLLAAAAEGEENLILLSDVEEMLLLAFEMLCGRAIPMLVVGYRGDWRVAKATDELERSRNEYRVAQVRVHSRLKAIIARLNDNEVSQLPSRQASGSATDLLDTVRAGFEQLTDAIKTSGQLVYKGYWNERSALRHHIDALRSILRLYQSLCRAYHQVQHRYVAFLDARQRWERLLATQPSDPQRIDIARRRKGLRIDRQMLCLEDEQKLALAESLADYFRDQGIKLRDQRVYVGTPGRESLVDAGVAKHFAMRIMSALSFHIGLSQPHVQRAIGAINAINLSGLEPGTSATNKVGLGSALVQEVEQRLDRLAEHLATTLVVSYGVPLDEAAIQLLHDEFGARIDRLRTLATSYVAATNLPLSSAKIPPPVELDLTNINEREQKRAQRIIERYEPLLQTKSIRIRPA